MARYCFYCGKELATGEKCHCRARQTARGTAFDAAGQQAASGTGSGDATGPAGSRQPFGSHEGFASDSAGSATGQGQGASGAHSTWESRAEDNFSSASAGARGRDSHTGQTHHQTDPGQRQRRAPFWRRQRTHTRPQAERAAGRTLNLNFFAGLRYLTNPVAVIREGIQHGDRLKALIFLLIQAALTGFFVLRAAGHPVAAAILALIFPGVIRANGFLLFFQSALISVFLSVIFMSLVWLITRLASRQRIAWQHMFFGLYPSNLYYALFLLLALSSLRGSPIYSLLLVLFGFFISAGCVFLAVRSLVQVNENRFFFIVAITLIVFAGILSMFIGAGNLLLTTRAISPSPAPVPVIPNA